MKSISPVETYKSLFSELFVKLISFSLEDEFEEDLMDSVAFFYGLEEGDRYEFKPEDEFLFLCWFLLDDTDADGHCLLDTFTERHSDSLSLQETQICKALRETNLTLLEVRDVIDGKSLVLKDLFLGEEFTVQEALGSQGIAPGTLLYTRVLKLSDVRFLVGAGLFLNSQVVEPLTTYILTIFQEECELSGELNMRSFLKENGELINHWIQAYQKGEMPTAVPDEGGGE